MHRQRAALIFSLALTVTAACGGGSGTVDATGEYTLSVTNGSNGCGFANWTQGDQSSGIPLSVTQDQNDHVTATLGGAVGTLAKLVLGSNVFTGNATGTRLTLTLYGTRSQTQGNCTYTINAEVDARLDGDLLEGTIAYHASTNNSPDCGTLTGCTSEQQFNGTRPPTK